MCPPDILHTIIGGILKDFLFYACVIVSILGKRNDTKRIYRDNLSRLDQKIKSFPTKQALNYPIKRLPQGITPYVTSTTGPLRKKKLSNSAMSNLDHQDVPGIVLQILICILDESIFPKEYNFRLSNNININMRNTILIAGWKCLNLFFNLRRTAFSRSQLDDLMTQIKSVIYEMYVLFRLKQDLLGVTNNYGGLISIYLF